MPTAPTQTKAAWLRGCLWLCVTAAALSAEAPLLAGGPPRQPAKATGVASLREALAGVSEALSALGEPGAQYILLCASDCSPLDTYSARMLAAHLRGQQRGISLLDAKLPLEDGEPPGRIPEPLLHRLRSAGADLMVYVASRTRAGERQLLTAAYEVAAGSLRARSAVPCHLSADTAALVSQEPVPLEASDRRWLRLFRYLFEPVDGRTAANSSELDRAEARCFFDLGLWRSAARAFGELADSRPGTDLLHAAVALQLMGDWEQATELVQEALKRHPDSAPLWALRGWLSLRQRSPGDAVMWLEQARLTGMAREGVYRYARGLMALEQGQEAKAREELSRAAEGAGEVHFVQLQLARFHRNRAELEEAIAAYRRAARSPGATADTWSELAVALEARGDVEGAIAALRRGFQLDSADLALVKHLAGLLKSEARWNEALDILRRAAEAHPYKPSLLAEYGETAFQMWKLDTAERAFRDAIRAAGSFSYARARLAALLAARRQYAEARALAADLVAERPDYQPGRIALAGILAEIGRTSEAAKILKEATLSPEHEADARVALTELHLMAGEPQQAVESARIAAHARATAQTYAVLSRAFLGARNVGEAITAARTALQKDEQSPAAHVALARALMVKNELEEAMQHAQAALEAYPYSVEALEVAGEIEAARADWQKCAEYWQRALALNPWDGPLHRRISEVLGPHLGDWAGTAEHHQRYVELEKMKAAVAR